MTGTRPRDVIVDIADPYGGRVTRPLVPGSRPRPVLMLLGGFRLTVAGLLVELPVGTQRLVALLALRGRISRSRLAGTLWSETTEHRALASLRTGIWRVNQAAPDLITCTGGGVDIGPSVDVDVHRMVATAVDVMRQDVADVSGPTALQPDDGELLPEWEDDWLLADRERLRQLRLHMLEAVAEQLAREGRFGLALEAALAALRADTLRESAHRMVIRIHLAEGNLVEARRAYDTCRCLLERDVGVQPSAVTRMLLRPDDASQGRGTPSHSYQPPWRTSQAISPYPAWRG